MTKLAAAQAEILELRARLAAREEALRSHEDELVQLRAQIAWLKKQLFGSKSERLDRRQLELMLEGLEERAARLEAAAPAVGPARAAPQPRLPREERYGHLPVLEEVVHEPAEVLAEPEAYERIGEERTFEVVYEPGRFYRRAIIRPKYRRKADRQVAPLVVPAPARVVEGIASIELLVQLVLSKYLDHQPLYRQCRIYQREGVSFARPSLVRWVETVADWLKPIYHYMGKELKAGGYIQADETPIHYLDADVQKGKARQGYLVPFSRPGGDVVFTWALSRSEKAITPFLTGFKGLLQTTPMWFGTSTPPGTRTSSRWPAGLMPGASSIRRWKKPRSPVPSSPTSGTSMRWKRNTGRAGSTRPTGGLAAKSRPCRC